MAYEDQPSAAVPGRESPALLLRAFGAAPEVSRVTRGVALLLLLALGVALLLRWPHLADRPMHNDEAVNAIKFGQLWQGGGYKYDPNEHHGPTLPYATLALSKLTGAPPLAQFTDARLRWLTVLFGLGLIALLPLLADALARRGTAWAALFLAVSPSMVFYSQDYIHEMLLVGFTLLAIGAAWRYWNSRKLGWALVTGLAVGLMHATKETFVITLFCAAVALGLNAAWTRLIQAVGAPARKPRLNYWHLAAALGLWVGVAVILFSSFFANASGPLDSVRTYLPWLQRAGGESPHIHPWHFYLHRLLFFHVAKGPVWTEFLIFVLAAVGAWAGFARRGLGRSHAGFVRFLALFTFVLTAFYSALGYKTPWCLLNFWAGAILLAGVGAAVLVRSLQNQWLCRAAQLLLLAGAAHLGWQAWQGSSVYAADRRNPYVYAQTSPDLLKLVAQVESLAAVAPAGHDTIIKVIGQDGDYWPLPWYLRNFSRVGWYDRVPDDPFAPVVIASASLRAGLDEKKTHLMVRFFELRPQTFLELYVQKDLWQQWLAKHPPKTDD